MGLYRRTWRGKAARIHRYYDQGRDLWERVKGIAVLAIGVKVFFPGVPMWAYVLGGITVPVIFVVVGYAWVHRGWYRESSEQSIMDRWTPLEIAQMHWWIRLLRANRVDPNHFDPHSVPPEVLAIMASVQKPRI